MPLVRENESNLWPVIVVVYALYHMGNIYAEFYVCVSFNKTVTIHISICFFSWLLQKSSNSNYVFFYIWRTKTSLSDSHVWLYWNINNWGLFLSRRLVDRITCHTESPLVPSLFVEFGSRSLKSVYKKSNVVTVYWTNLLWRRGEVYPMQIWCWCVDSDRHFTQTCVCLVI